MAKFKDIIGQEQIKGHLQSAITMDKVSHAYILHGELGAYKVYEDEQHTVYELTDLFYTDLDAYIDFFLTTRSDIHFDEQIRKRVHSIYDYYKVKDNLTDAFYYNLP